jgi:DNA sulfur modification protein DndE
MNLQLRDEILAANFRPSEAAAHFEAMLRSRLGGPHRYEVVRLMLGRSLIESDSPKPVSDADRAVKGDIRGRELFGTEIDLWMALFAIDGGMQENSGLEDFKGAVEAHWARGSALIKDDFERAESDIVQMAMSIANLLPDRTAESSGNGTRSVSHGALTLRIGPLSENAETGEPVEFVLNRVGSPHIVLMGKTGQGKTRVGVDLAQQILASSHAPMIYIDPKPDFAPGGNYHGAFDAVCNATNLVVGKQPIPLDFLPRADRGSVSLQAACMRLRDSICRSTPSAGPVQRDRLLTCIEHVARNDRDRSLNRIAAEYDAALATDAARGDSVSSMLNELTRFGAFEPELRADEFFPRSWVLSLAPEIPESFKNLIMQLLLDAELAYWESQDDAPMTEGHRSLRHLLVIDEARRILKTARSESLVGMITRTRSRGCCVMLLSQNPGDFEGADYDFMSQIGAVIGFACNQSERGLTALKGPFGRKLMANEFSDSRLTEGLALCKLPQRAPEVIRCWQ